MRFMTLVKSAETLSVPPQALLDAMEQPRTEAIRAGTLITTGGLAPTRLGARVRVEKGKLTVIDGPFTEAKEVVGGYAILELPSRQDAIDSARWLMQLFIEHWPEWEGETEVRQMMDGPPSGS